MTKEKALRLLKNTRTQWIHIHKSDNSYDYDPDELEALNMAISALECQNIYKDNTNWIPVGEGLPGFHKDVLLSLRSLDVEVGFRAETEPYFYCHGDYIEPQNVLAWMPLPEPYEQEE